jgi:hypothetical protein
MLRGHEYLHRLAVALNVGAVDLLEAGGPVDLRRPHTSTGLSARTLFRSGSDEYVARRVAESIERAA